MARTTKNNKRSNVTDAARIKAEMLSSTKVIPTEMAFIASPLHGDVANNIRNAQRYCRFVYELGFIPFSPQLLMTQFLDDYSDIEQQIGLAMNLQVMEKCECMFVFGNITENMLAEIKYAKNMGLPIRVFDAEMREILPS